jgi:hypothetical protein
MSSSPAFPHPHLIEAARRNEVPDQAVSRYDAAHLADRIDSHRQSAVPAQVG